MFNKKKRILKIEKVIESWGDYFWGKKVKIVPYKPPSIGLIPYIMKRINILQERDRKTKNDLLDESIKNKHENQHLRNIMTKMVNLMEIQRDMIQENSKEIESLRKEMYPLYKVKKDEEERITKLGDDFFSIWKQWDSIYGDEDDKRNGDPD